MRDKGQFVRNRHAQAPQSPIDLSRRRPHEIAYELRDGIDLEGQIDAIATQGLQDRVMHQGRARMAYRAADDAVDLALACNLFSPIEIVQFADGRLPARAFRASPQRAEA